MEVILGIQNYEINKLYLKEIIIAYIIWEEDFSSICSLLELVQQIKCGI